MNYQLSDWDCFICIQCTLQSWDPLHHTTTLHHAAPYCTTQRHTATHCTTLHHTAPHCDTLQHTTRHSQTPQDTATHSISLPHTATQYTPHCTTLQTLHNNVTPQSDTTMRHTATHCNTLRYTATNQSSISNRPGLHDIGNIGTATLVLQHAATRCNTLQHTYPLPPTAQALTQQWQTMHTCMYVCMCPWCVYPPAPMNHVNIFKGWPPRDAPSELVQLGYKKFPPDHIDQVEMKSQLGWVLKPVPHNLVRGIRFWKTKS